MDSATLATADGLKLHLQCWPAAAAPRGTVLIVHGLGEHIGRYGAVAERLAGEGWRVVGHDQRGHGRSPGARGALPAQDALLDDLARVVDHARAAQRGPLVLLGHSLGGLIAGRFVAEALADAPAPWSRPVDALVMSSPALEPGMNAGQRLLLAVLGPLAPRLALSNGLKPAWISREPAVVSAYEADPLVHDRVTPALARFIVDAGVLVLQRAAWWKLPTLLMWAGADRCVAPGGSAEFAASAPEAVLDAQCWPGLFHEIFNEPESGKVLDRLCDWLRERGPTLAAEPAPRNRHERTRSAAAAAPRRGRRAR